MKAGGQWNPGDKKVEKVGTEGGTPFLLECYNTLCQEYEGQRLLPPLGGMTILQ